MPVHDRDIPGLGGEPAGIRRRGFITAGWLSVGCGLAMPILWFFPHMAHGLWWMLLNSETELIPFVFTGVALLEVAAAFFGIVAVLKSDLSRTPLREAVLGVTGVCLFLGTCHFNWTTHYVMQEGLKGVIEPSKIWPRVFKTESFIDEATNRQLRNRHEAFRSLASKNKGLLPALADVPGRLMHGAELDSGPVGYVAFSHPHFMRLISDPAHRQQKYADDWSWFYLGYAVRNDEQMEAFLRIYRERVGTGRGFEEDVPSPAFPDALMRRLSVPTPELPPDGRRPPLPPKPGPPDVPVLIGRVEHYGYKGAHVLYLDGRVEYVEYPGKWPMTQKTVALLNDLDAMGERPAGASQ